MSDLIPQNITLPETLPEAHQLIVKMALQIEQLEHQLEQLLEHNARAHSGNSSQPPSHDASALRAQRHQRQRNKPHSERSVGAQPGHEKHERPLAPESEVDHIERYEPPVQCPCGGHIMLDDTPCQRHQILEVPRVRFQITEHQCYAGHCTACPRRYKAQMPDTVPLGQMGPNLLATIAELSGRFHLSVREIQQHLQTFFGLSLSIGAISKAQKRAMQAMIPVYTQLHEAVQQADVLHADETTHWRHTNHWWMWVASDGRVCYYPVHGSRGKSAADCLLGAFTGVLVTDRHGAYNDQPPDMRQFCWAHLLRDFIRISERAGRAGQIGSQLVRCALLVFTLQRRRQGAPPDTQYRLLLRLLKVRALVRRRLELGSALPGKTGRTCQNLLKAEVSLWVFLAYDNVPLDNNDAERLLRPYVIWRKTSFATRSARGDLFRAQILSVTQTLKKLGLSSYDFLCETMAAFLRPGGQPVRIPL